MSQPDCIIDDCPRMATWLIESYPDNVTLCDEHVDLHHDEFFDGLLPWETKTRIGVSR